MLQGIVSPPVECTESDVLAMWQLLKAWMLTWMPPRADVVSNPHGDGVFFLVPGRPSPRLVSHRRRSWSNGLTETVLLGPTFSPPQPFHALFCFCSLLPTSEALFRATSDLFWSKISLELVASCFWTAFFLARGSGTYFVLALYMIFLIVSISFLVSDCKRSQVSILLSMWCGEKSRSFC